MGNSDIEQVQALETRSEPEKTPGTAFRGDYATGVVDMSPVEKRLLIKARLLLATLMALMYFAAYLVRIHPSLAESLGLASKTTSRTATALEMPPSWVWQRTYILEPTTIPMSSPCSVRYPDHSCYLYQR